MTWIGKERKGRGVEEFELFTAQKKKKEQWMSDWLSEWEAGRGWEGLWPCGSAEVNSASPGGWIGGKNRLSLKEEDPPAPGWDQTGWFIRAMERERVREREREMVASISIKTLQHKRGIQKCRCARHEDGLRLSRTRGRITHKRQNCLTFF